MIDRNNKIRLNDLRCTVRPHHVFPAHPKAHVVAGVINVLDKHLIAHIGFLLFLLEEQKGFFLFFFIFGKAQLFPCLKRSDPTQLL